MIRGEVRKNWKKIIEYLEIESRDDVEFYETFNDHLRLIDEIQDLQIEVERLKGLL